MQRKSWRMAALVLIGGCATTSPAVVMTAPAGRAAVACAARVLEERGYDLRKPDKPGETLQAERRLVYAPMGAVREIITASVDGTGTPARLQATVRAWDYQPAQHDLPIDRQSVTEIRPSREAVTDARAVLEGCGPGAERR